MNDKEIKDINLIDDIDKCEQELKIFKEELVALRYAISHDLRAPIKTINSYLELVFEDFNNQLPAGAVDYLNKVKNAGSNLDNMVEGLLLLTKIYHMEFSPTTVYINDIVSQNVAQLRAKYPDNTIRISVEPDMEVIGDEDLIYLAYQKLLENAWKFSSAKPHAHIDIGMVKKEGEQTEFFVKDNGVGFDMKHADKLFIPFQRRHSSNQLEGNGIGLASVLRIIKRHGGKIWVESTLNKGAKFYFTFGGHLTNQ